MDRAVELAQQALAGFAGMFEQHSLGGLRAKLGPGGGGGRGSRADSGPADADAAERGPISTLVFRGLADLVEGSEGVAAALHRSGRVR